MPTTYVVNCPCCLGRCTPCCNGCSYSTGSTATVQAWSWAGEPTTPYVQEYLVGTSLPNVITGDGPCSWVGTGTTTTYDSMGDITGTNTSADTSVAMVAPFSGESPCGWVVNQDDDDFVAYVVWTLTDFNCNGGTYYDADGNKVLTITINENLCSNTSTGSSTGGSGMMMKAMPRMRNVGRGKAGCGCRGK